MTRLLSCAALASALCVGGFTPAGAADDIAKQLIANPNPGSWQVYGPQSNKRIKDAAVQGGKAFEVVVATKPENPWTVAASNPITGKIAKGDKIVGVIWLKATIPGGGSANLPLRIQVNAAPYTALVEKTVEVGKDWDKYEIHTTADKDYGANTTVVQVHLGGGQQTVDLGPAFILDMGPG